MSTAIKVNPRELKQAEIPEGLESFIDDLGIPRRGGIGSWGMFGWEGYCADRAIQMDSVPAIRFCHDQEMIDHETRLLGGDTLRAYCRKRGKTAVERLLMGLGYPA